MASTNNFVNYAPIQPVVASQPQTLSTSVPNKDEDNNPLEMYNKYLKVKHTTFKNVNKDHFKVSRVFDPQTLKFELRFKCMIAGCDKFFKKSCNIKDHIRLHSGIKPYKCSECTKTFTQKGNLKKHFNIMHIRRANTMTKKMILLDKRNLLLS